MRNKIIILLILVCSLPMQAQNLIVGTLKNKKGEAVSNALVEVRGTNGGKVLTDKTGAFTVNGKNGDYLQVTTADGKSKTIKVNGSTLNIIVGEGDALISKGLSFETAMKESTISSSTVNFDQMEKFSTFNPMNALFGNLNGLTVLGNGGPSFSNNPTITIRGVATLNNSNPLILVDGIERPLDRLAVSEIESVTVLKDAAAVAIYGIRGANGVLLVKTKRGEYGKIKVDVKYQHGITTPIRLPKMVDAPTYAKALNEGLLNDGLAARYTNSEIDLFANGTNPDLYPNVDWRREATKNQGSNNQLDITFNGGTERMRYYTVVNYTNDFGLTKAIPSDEGYNTEVNFYKLNLRTNLDVKLTNTTQMKVGIMGSIDDYNRPNMGPATIFNRIVNIPSSAFPVRTSSGKWGGSQIYDAMNPVASIAATGFVRSQNRILFADLNLEQDLSPILNGLTAELGMSYDNAAEYLDTRSRTYAYESNGVTYGTNSPLTPTAVLNDMYLNSTMRAKLNYITTFGDSKLTSFLLYNHEDTQRKTRNNHIARQNIVGGVTYGFKERYFVDVVGAYSGSSYLSTGDKFRFYPAVSAAWLISNESFMNGSSAIDMLKLRASFGYSGNDRMSYELDRQYFDRGPDYYFTGINSVYQSVKEGQLATKNLTAERSQKANIGVDAKLFKGLSLSLDAFYDKRTDILVSNSAVTSSIIGVEPSRSNSGIVENKGFELGVSYDGKAGDFTYGIGAQLAYAKNKIINQNEGYKQYGNLYTTGYPVGAYFGLKANGFFNNANEIASSNPQLFSTVLPGDIRYEDINKDGKIDANDVTYLGTSTKAPEFYFSFNVKGEYKGFGVDAQFQGLAGYTVVRNQQHVYWPLYNNGNISQWYYDRRWTPETAATATVPRLTTIENKNNYRANSIWMEDGSFLKLRYLDLYYNLKMSRASKIENVKLFVRGTNLFSLDNIKDSDPEMLAVGYPTLTTYLLGCAITF